MVEHYRDPASYCAEQRHITLSFVFNRYTEGTILGNQDCVVTPVEHRPVFSEPVQLYGATVDPELTVESMYWGFFLGLRAFSVTATINRIPAKSSYYTREPVGFDFVSGTLWIPSVFVSNKHGFQRMLAIDFVVTHRSLSLGERILKLKELDDGRRTKEDGH